MSELEERIITFIVDETRTERSSIQLDSNLATGLGIDGDDAAEFFEAFGEQFHVDLAGLWKHWNHHFEAEGRLCGFSLRGALASGAVIVVGGLLPTALGWNQVGAAVLLIALIAFLGLVMSSKRPQKAPITVQDLVDAATSGEWVER